MMDLENIEDMPSQGESNNWEEMVFSYNTNDVIATKELYKRTLPMIELRKNLSSMYKLNLLNASNTKIGSELLLDLYCKKTNKYKKDVRSLRTFRKKIIVKDIIFPYIKFKSKEFNNLLDRFNKIEIESTTKTEEISQFYKGFEFVYGKGGIHGSLTNIIAESDEDFIIIDADVSSLYPSIAIVNNLFPKHLGLEFIDVYNNDIVAVRLHHKKLKEKGNKFIVDGFKEAANATYGNSNSMYSWLYDPQYTMSTTINGQLMLTMLAEMLMDLPESNIIQINTDGLTMRIRRDSVDKYYELCKQWEELTKLELEYAEYSKMVISDVNNYLSFYKSGKYKAKGKYEFENVPLHKNKSHNIIPYAFFKHYQNNSNFEETIKNHENIFDFCAGVRAKNSPERGQSFFTLNKVLKGEIITEKLSKTVRYYISNKGSTLIKNYENGTLEHVEAPVKKGVKLIKSWKVTYFNKFIKKETIKEYDIDYSYYISKTREWINSLERIGQLKLF
jgi:hypothetical protein